MTPRKPWPVAITDDYYDLNRQIEGRFPNL